MALELARYNVRANALAPGYIVTEIKREFLEAGTIGERIVAGSSLCRGSERPGRRSAAGLTLFCRRCCRLRLRG
jgi:NAD(P)-dependent dehydrogenase (short-subunit alcohol dehydrogenase family)